MSAAMAIELCMPFQNRGTDLRAHVPTMYRSERHACGRVCGRRLLENLVGDVCGKCLWEVSVEVSAGVSVGSVCGRRLWEASVRGVSGRHLWESSVGGVCGRRLWELSVGGVSGSRLWRCLWESSVEVSVGFWRPPLRPRPPSIFKIGIDIFNCSGRAAT